MILGLLRLFLIYPFVVFANMSFMRRINFSFDIFLGYEIGVKRIVLGFLISDLAVAFGEWLK